jgi:lipid-binding SYLF domain-containing protein
MTAGVRCNIRFVGLAGALASLALSVALGGCKSPSGYTPAQQRESVLQMRDAALDALYASKPDLREHVESATGYAVFSNFGMKILVAGGGHGYGVVHNRATRKDTFMKMAEVNLGLGVGVQDFRAVFVFNDKSVMHEFIASGWEFGGDAEAGAKLNHGGAEVNASGTLGNVDVYKITKTGVVLAATLGGTKYWRDDKMNQPSAAAPAAAHAQASTE